MFLTEQQVEALTHRTRRDAQVRALRFMGIEHKKRPDGSVAVLRSHVEWILGDGAVAAKVEKETEPDWSAI